jgi:hypothetical protein
MNQQQVNIEILQDNIFLFLLATNSSNAPFNDESLYGTFGGLYYKRRVKKMNLFVSIIDSRLFLTSNLKQEQSNKNTKNIHQMFFLT